MGNVIKQLYGKIKKLLSPEKPELIEIVNKTLTPEEKKLQDTYERIKGFLWKRALLLHYKHRIPDLGPDPKDMYPLFSAYFDKYESHFTETEWKSIAEHMANGLEPHDPPLK